ncbi:MAG: hypothetical protein RLY93_11270 [Sumerlaeia bacterium]
MNTAFAYELKKTSRWARWSGGRASRRDIRSNFFCSVLLILIFSSFVDTLFNHLLPAAWSGDFEETTRSFTPGLIGGALGMYFYFTYKAKPAKTAFHYQARKDLMKEYRRKKSEWWLEPDLTDLVVLSHWGESPLGKDCRDELYGFLRIEPEKVTLETFFYHIQIPTSQFDLRQFLIKGYIPFQFDGHYNEIFISPNQLEERYLTILREADLRRQEGLFATT